MARDEILDAIVANQTIVRFLFRLVSTDSIPQEVFEEALSCLMTLSEDNLQLGQAIIDDQETRCYDALLKLKAAGGPRSVLACGVLHNVFSSLQWLDHSPGKDEACDAVLIPSLCRVLEQFSATSGKTNGHSVSNDSRIVQVALEILASIGTNLQSTLEKDNRAQFNAGKAEEEWNGIDDGDTDAMDVDGGFKDEGDKEDDTATDEEDSDSDDIDIDADMERVTGAEEPVDDGTALNDLPTLRELIRHAVPQLIRLANIPINNDDNIAVQTHALSALNNIAWTLACLEFADGENANIYTAWNAAAERIWLKVITPLLAADNADLNLLKLLAGLAWAVSRSLGGNTPGDAPQHYRFMRLYRDTVREIKANKSKDEETDQQEDPFQSLGVKCIGVLGSLARNPAPIKINRDVGVFLMTVLGHEKTPAAEVIEALNQVFDIYGDEGFACDSEVFWKDGFLKHLEELQPRLKALAKGIDKRKSEELRTKADEAVLNLGRFIRYKKKHAPR